MPIAKVSNTVSDITNVVSKSTFLSECFNNPLILTLMITLVLAVIILIIYWSYIPKKNLKSTSIKTVLSILSVVFVFMYLFIKINSRKSETIDLSIGNVDGGDETIEIINKLTNTDSMKVDNDTKVRESTKGVNARFSIDNDSIFN